MMEKPVDVSLLKTGERFADDSEIGGDHQLRNNFPIAGNHQLSMFPVASKLVQTQCGIHQVAYYQNGSTILSSSHIEVYKDGGG